MGKSANFLKISEPYFVFMNGTKVIIDFWVKLFLLTCKTYLDTGILLLELNTTTATGLTE